MAGKYIKALAEIMKDDSPAVPTARTRAEIEVDITLITAMLRGPLSNTERLLLVADKRDLQKQLGAIA